MRKLTFKGFLSQYIKRLSRKNTLNIQTLAKEALTSNARLREPLVLYTVVFGKTDLLRKAISDTENGSVLLRDMESIPPENPEKWLMSEKAPERYRKIWASFLAASGSPGRDDALKTAMREKIIRMQQSKSCSNYRIYTDLKLNPGNTNSWLKNGDNTKVSYRTAERIIDFVSRY